MKICILASGSTGNCIFLLYKSTRILIDAGISARETIRRLAQIGEKLSSINAICLTHEHADHVTGLAVLHKNYGINLYANAGTLAALQSTSNIGQFKWHVFTTGSPFYIDDLTLEPFAVPHDAYEPVGFIISSADTRVGIVTDIGISTCLARNRLKGCHVLVIESNHDEQLLAGARRPWSIKQRITSRQGHLSNHDAAEMIAEVASPNLKCVFLFHLSQDCNRPELALKETAGALKHRGYSGVDVLATYPKKISIVWSSSAASNSYHEPVQVSQPALLGDRSNKEKT